MLNFNVKVPEDIVSRENQDGTVVIMRLDDGNSFYKINGIAAMVWKSLSHQQDLNQTKINILNEYSVDENTLNTDIDNLITDLLTKKLLQKN